MSKATKYEYMHVLQGFYAHGWEDLCAAPDNWEGGKEIKSNLKDYRENEGGVYRIIRRRELRNEVTS